MYCLTGNWSEILHTFCPIGCPDFSRHLEFFTYSSAIFKRCTLKKSESERALFISKFSVCAIFQVLSNSFLQRIISGELNICAEDKKPLWKKYRHFRNEAYQGTSRINWSPWLKLQSCGFFMWVPWYCPIGLPLTYLRGSSWTYSSFNKMVRSQAVLEVTEKSWYLQWGNVSERPNGFYSSDV